jgi:hypothetical protein
MANNVRIGVSAPGAKQASSEMDQLRDKFSKLKAEGAKGIAIGAGAAATAKAFDLVGTAITGVVGFLGDAAAAAREDEESQSRLRASLQANIEGWDGNTDAIEKVIAARQQLGFTDEEQRTSLAILVAATHDYNKALEVQRTAMDLARLKGISLAEASSALTKVEGGQFRALKALGIVLKDGATATDALAAVQKVATGQADSFAATNQGKLLVSQIKVSEAMEKLGYVVMPALADAAVVVSDAISFVAENMGTLAPIALGLAGVLTVSAIPSLVAFATAAAAAAVAAAPILLVGAGSRASGCSSRPAGTSRPNRPGRRPRPSTRRRRRPPMPAWRTARPLRAWPTTRASRRTSPDRRTSRSATASPRSARLRQGCRSGRDRRLHEDRAGLAQDAVRPDRRRPRRDRRLLRRDHRGRQAGRHERRDHGQPAHPRLIQGDRRREARRSRRDPPAQQGPVRGARRSRRARALVVEGVQGRRRGAAQGAQVRARRRGRPDPRGNPAPEPPRPQGAGGQDGHRPDDRQGRLRLRAGWWRR